jgi:UDP-N-acetylglucosamine diphosphorylase / glucose-1-phosphate thymidylyltransferase / UDP-N-acetylgalactosamine diphosphorylase / glucosamine-1-phosphate N-acetyltransferase / galactosamine-1-phosphate N-acetyltransferase
MNYILFDDPQYRVTLLPFTFTRPVSQLRSGIVTIAEKWEHLLRSPVSNLTEEYLQAKFTYITTDDNTYINASVLPNSSLVKAIKKLKTGQKLIQEDVLIAYRTDVSFKLPTELITTTQALSKAVTFPEPITVIRKSYDLFIQNGAQIRFDFKWLTEGRESVPISDAHTSVYNPSEVFVEEGAIILSAVLNAQAGPIYIGKNTQIQEGSLIRGAFAICEVYPTYG